MRIVILITMLLLIGLALTGDKYTTQNQKKSTFNKQQVTPLPPITLPPSPEGVTPPPPKNPPPPK